MSPYVDPDIISDETSVAESILASIADQVPGLRFSEGSPITSWSEAVGIVAATLATLLKDEAKDSYRGVGERILGIARRREGVARGVSDWSMKDATGYTIPDGTQLFFVKADGSQVAFATVGATVIPPGESAAVGVPIIALEPGTASNGIVGIPAATDPMSGLMSVEVPVATSEGSDAETVDEYVDRVADRATRLRVIAITRPDYAAIPLDIPGVARCLAVNLLDPDDPPGSGEEPEAGGHITVFPIDASGEASSPLVAAAVQALLLGDERPLNVRVHVEEPTYTTVTASLSVRISPDAVFETVVADIQAAVQAYLSPASWRLDESEPGRWIPPLGPDGREVRATEIAHLARHVPGVTVVLDAGVGTTPEPTDEVVDLPGFAPLPRPGDVWVTAEVWS